MGKALSLGLVDARSPTMEEVEVLKKQVSTVMTTLKPKALYLTPNTGFEYIGWTLGTNKIGILGKVKEEVRDNVETISCL